MTRKLKILIVLHLLCNWISAQNIVGSFSLLSNQTIKLEGFKGLKTYPIANTKTDDKGNFKLNYFKADHGIGYLVSKESKKYLVILNGEDLEIKGASLDSIESIRILKGQENLLFGQYAQEHPKREQALSAWEYLEKIYTLDSLFLEQEITKRAIMLEKQRIKDQDSLFLARLPNGSYVTWYIPVRKLVSSVAKLVEYNSNEIPSVIASFRTLDYTSPKLYNSGLFKDAIDSHFWLLENSGVSIDSIFTEMQISIDTMVENLITDEKILNEVTHYLFNLLEQHSLFQASEHLALNVLNKSGFILDDNVAKQLETYRAMKIGVIAPDIKFKNFYAYNKSNHLPKFLSEFKSKFTLVFFGASWCQKCNEDLPKIARLYSKWKAKGVEIIFVSLDEENADFISSVKNFPFISICDLNKWGGEIVKNYHVFTIPSMYLLDSKREILLRPNSVEQMDAWIDWFLVKGHK